MGRKVHIFTKVNDRIALTGYKFDLAVVNTANDVVEQKEEKEKKKKLKILLRSNKQSKRRRTNKLLVTPQQLKQRGKNVCYVYLKKILIPSPHKDHNIVEQRRQRTYCRNKIGIGCRLEGVFGFVVRMYVCNARRVQPRQRPATCIDLHRQRYNAKQGGHRK